MNIDMGFDFGFGFAWGVATAITVISCIWWIAKGCFSLVHAAVKHFEKKKYEKISEDYCLNPFKDRRNK